MEETICIGWDVGGWLGSKQAVAVMRASVEHLKWLGAPQTFTIKQLSQAGGSVLDLARIAWPDAPGNMTDQYNVVLAIDAPLGLPIGYQRLLNGQIADSIQLRREIDSRYAYRESDRHVYQTFGKKPLSAPFDKLGNNATVAMHHANRWAVDEGYSVAPFHAGGGQHVIIEVYPALVKDKATGSCLPQVARFLPPALPPRSDELDAAICAFHAVAFALNGKRHDLPGLVNPPAHLDAATVSQEGWIYYLPSSWLASPESSHAPSAGTP